MIENKLNTGQLLVSKPYMMDPNFKRTVILLCEHQDEGSIGFILNRKFDISVSEVVPELKITDIPIYQGGPVQIDTLHFLHNKGDLIEGSVPITDDLFWGGNFENLKVLIESGEINPVDDLRFFLGYSGWGPGQLDDEFKSESWLLAGSNAEHVFEDEPGSLWNIILKEMGNEYAVVSHFPEDPSLN